MKKTIMVILFILILFDYGLCGWKGPTVVVSGKWGGGDNEFGFVNGDMGDNFPIEFGVNNNGFIYIQDPMNQAIHKYDNNGNFISNIVSPDIHNNKKNWRHNLLYVGINGGVMVDGHYHDRVFINADDKIIVSKIPQGGIPVYITEKGYYFFDCNAPKNSAKNYHLYSTDGNYIGLFPESSIDKIATYKNSTYLGDDKHEHQLKFSDGHLYKVVNSYFGVDYYRDKNKTVYWESSFYGKSNEQSITIYNISRQTYCSDETTQLILPNSINGPKHPPIEDKAAYYSWRPTIVEEYGRPIVSDNCDIYCWKRTPETYSILKWTWRDSPDSPINLKTTPTKTTISLAWKAPEEDSANIKEYEITRSVMLCGPFEPVGTVKKGVLSFDDKKVEPAETYYYKIRAIKEDKSYSGFSNKVTGTLEQSL